MSNQPIYLTPEGEAKLLRELEELRGSGRQALAKRLRQAVQMGDLSENADYITAKEAQAFLEGRIQELEIVLREAVVVEADKSADRVQIGSSVVVSQDGAKPETYLVVGAKEADPRRGKISHESPIGRALMGRRVNETVIAETPGGKIQIKILELHSDSGSSRME